MKDNKPTCYSCIHYRVCGYVHKPQTSLPFPLREGTYATEVLNQFQAKLNEAYAEACAEYKHV